MLRELVARRRRRTSSTRKRPNNWPLHMLAQCYVSEAKHDLASRCSSRLWRVEGAFKGQPSRTSR